jgi:hypothetical protein
MGSSLKSARPNEKTAVAVGSQYQIKVLTIKSGDPVLYVTAANELFTLRRPPLQPLFVELADIAARQSAVGQQALPFGFRQVRGEYR